MQLQIINRPDSADSAQTALDVISDINDELTKIDRLIDSSIEKLNATMNKFYNLPLPTLVSFLNILGPQQVQDIMVSHKTASISLNNIVEASTGIPGDALVEQLVTISADPDEHPQVLLNDQGVFVINEIEDGEGDDDDDD